MLSFKKWYVLTRIVPAMVVLSIFVYTVLSEEVNWLEAPQGIILFITVILCSIVLFPYEYVLTNRKKLNLRWATLNAALSHYLGQQEDITKDSEHDYLILEDVRRSPYNELRDLHKKALKNLKFTLMLKNNHDLVQSACKRLFIQVNTSSQIRYYGPAYFDAITMYKIDAYLAEPTYYARYNLTPDESKKYKLGAYIFRALISDMHADHNRIRYFYENQLAPSMFTATMMMEEGEYQQYSELPTSWVLEMFSNEDSIVKHLARYSHV